MSAALVKAAARSKALQVLIVAVLGALPAPVATADAAESCPNEQLRAESKVNLLTGQPYSTQLPDCRAFELVSPPETNALAFPVASAQVQFRPDFAITARGVLFADSQATPPGTGALPNGENTGVFRSVRTPAGWVTHDMLPSTQPMGGEFERVSADGSAALISTPMSLSPEDLDNPENNPFKGEDLYVVRDVGTPPQFVTHGELSDVSARGHIAVAQRPALANPELTAVGFQLQEVNEPLSPLDPGTAPNCYIWADARAGLAGLTNAVGSGTPNCRYFAVAADGRPIIENTSGAAGTGGIFAVDPFPNGGGVGGASTTQLSGPTPGVAGFDALSPDGQTAYITTTDPLSPEASGGSGPNLYAVSASATKAPVPTTCISCGHNGSGPTWIGQSADGSHVFFQTSEGIWSWSEATGALELAPASDNLGHFVFSYNGEYAVADGSSMGELYLLAEGAPPKLITSPGPTSDFTPVAVSDTGTRVVYDEMRAGSPSVIDEWSERQLDQISPIRSQHDYSAMGTSGPELEDVFLEGHEPLVSQDLNAGTTDIYDARVDGGFSAPREPTNNGLTPSPLDATPSPYTANMPVPDGQLAPLPADTSQAARPKGAKAKPCKRGFLRQRVKCMKRKAKKAKRSARKGGRG